jgi:hypothetical protein
MTYFRWPNKTAIGSSYCLDQSPGAERYGGLTVTIRWRTADKGTITSKATSFRKSDALDEPLVHALARVAEEGLREAARGLSVDLNDFDITLSDFAFHPVDSRDELYRHAAGSAFRSAWEAWERWYAAIAERRKR